MHEGFVNFNAGTARRLDGRGPHLAGRRDRRRQRIGGGTSIRGRCPADGEHRVSIGRARCSGANAGVGISLGDDCVVEAGLYVTAGSKIVLADEPRSADGWLPHQGAQLSGRDGILFREFARGAIEAVGRAGVGVTLNKALHA